MHIFLLDNATVFCCLHQVGLNQTLFLPCYTLCSCRGMLLLSLANPPFRYEEETYLYTISQILSFRFTGETKARACSTGTLSNNCDCLSMSREEIRGWLLEYTHTIYFIGCTYFNHWVFLFKSCLLCVTFCRLTPVSVPDSFPFHEGFWKRGLRDCLCWLLGHAQFSGPCPSKIENHPPGELAGCSESTGQQI